MPASCVKRAVSQNRIDGKKITALPIRSFIKNEKGDALVEAVIIFPIMIMIFAGLVLLAIYLPTRAALQHATQYAATALATERSDTWLFFDKDSMTYYRRPDRTLLTNVYVALFSGAGDVQTKGDDIVTAVEGRAISSKAGALSVECHINNWIVYKEVVVTAVREFSTPVDLSLIGFPETIPVTVTSTAVIQNGDEFVRNMDLACDFVKFIAEKFGISDVSETISSFGSRVSSLFGW